MIYALFTVCRYGKLFKQAWSTYWFMRLARILNPDWAGWPMRRPRGLSPRIADALVQQQYCQLRDNIPVIYMAIAAITVGAALANETHTAPLLQQLIPALLLSGCVIQILRWRRRRQGPVTAEIAEAQLRRTTLLASLMTTGGSLWSVLAFASTVPGRMPLAPVFMFFGAFAFVNCLASVPRAAFAVLFFGLTPLSVAMIMSGDPGFAAMAISVLLVGLLQARLVLQRFVENAETLILRDELESLARTDPLTGLLNRRALSDRLTERLNDERTVPFVVVMLDLDSFKPVNDEHGHAAGDAVLCAVAGRLTQSLREGDLVARLGGDEFALVFDAPHDIEALDGRLASMALTLNRPYRVAGVQIRVTASIGAALFPRDGCDADSLFAAADAALYRAKANAGTKLRAVRIESH